MVLPGVGDATRKSLTGERKDGERVVLLGPGSRRETGQSGGTGIGIHVYTRRNGGANQDVINIKVGGACSARPEVDERDAGAWEEAWRARAGEARGCSVDAHECESAHCIPPASVHRCKWMKCLPLPPAVHLGDAR